MKQLWILLLLLGAPVFGNAEINSVDHDEAVQAASADQAGAAKVSLFGDKTETSWGFAGAPPTKMIFNDTWFQRSMSYQINEKVYGDETDERLKKRLYRGNGLRVGIDGITLKKVKGRPGEVQVDIVGPIRVLHIPDTISQRDLEGGKPIQVTFPKVGRTFAGLGSAEGGGTLEFHFDLKAGKLVMDKLTADFTLSLGTTSKDSDAIGRHELSRTTFDYRPDMEKKYLLEDR